MANGCAQVCDCNMTLVNTGVGCTPIKKVEKITWLMNQFNSAGALNYIDLTITLSDSYFQALLNNVDPLARLYPLPPMVDIVDEREKPITYAYKDGTKRFVRNGVRSFAGMFPPESASPQLVGILEGGRCANLCKFAIDAQGTIWGRISDDGTKLYPVKLVAGSVAALWTNETDSTPQMIGYSFDYHPSEQDCQLRGLQQNQLVGDIYPQNYTGLIEVYAKLISASHAAGTVVVKLYDSFGSILSPETVKGLLAANFTLYDNTASSAVTFTVVESPQGTYTFTITGTVPASGHTLTLTPNKNGFDFTNVVATSLLMGA